MRLCRDACELFCALDTYFFPAPSTHFLKVLFIFHFFTRKIYDREVIFDRIYGPFSLLYSDFGKVLRMNTTAARSRAYLGNLE